MYYKQLGNHGVRVSPICLGTMMFGGQTEEALAIEIMHKAIDKGINFFDTADMYNGGESEVLVGLAHATASRRGRLESWEAYLAEWSQSHVAPPGLESFECPLHQFCSSLLLVRQSETTPQASCFCLKSCKT